MLIDDAAARDFIRHYQALLQTVAELEGIAQQKKYQNNVLLLLAHARNAMLKNLQLQQQALKLLQEEGMAWPEDMDVALRTLRVDRWIYLRDTAHYAVFLEMQREAAYGVQCLTTRLRDMLGATGAIVQCGLLVFRGQVLCDGLLSFNAWIGPNYKSSFNDTVAQLRRSGQFYRDSVLTVGSMSAQKSKTARVKSE